MAKTLIRLPGPDRYEFNARLRPALFAVLPLLVLPAVWLPEVWTLLGGITTLLATCGVTFLMGQIARSLGRRLEARLGGKVGVGLTTRMIGHGDTTIDPLTKGRYHEFLKGQGLSVPTNAEELASPDAARQAWLACSSWLVARTRDKTLFHLLSEENISYGYRRNLLALKPLALAALAVALGVNAWAVWQHAGPPDTQYWAGMAVGMGMILAAAIWIFVVTESFVVDASRAYGQRLLEACDQLGAAKKGARGKREARSS